MAFSPMMLVSSCKDDYPYDNEEPKYLGASIYNCLETEGNFKYFLRLIDDLDYKEVLSKTGSKTLFPARDAAFDRFFQSNPYGVRSYEELTPAQKRGIMNSSMVNMAYLSDMLPNVAGSNGANEGLALRRNTACSYLDTITNLNDAELFKNKYWSRFNGKGVRLIEQNPPMIVHFTDKLMSVQGVTGSDFSTLYNGLTFGGGDIFVNGIKVEKKDIICKNGYVHVLEDVLLPAENMAEVIESNGDTETFSRLMNKFSAPYYDEARAKEVYDYYNGSSALRPLFPKSDSIFVKGYFNEYHPVGPSGESLSSYGLLYYDPANPVYSNSSSEQDMGAMFVPSDEAMSNYINSSKGRYLKDAYGDWDNIPTAILSMFLKNHQKKSFIASLPHTWNTLTDETSNAMNIKAGDIKKTVIANNGAVYIANRVFPPIDYQCVYGPVLITDNTKIMKWAITDNQNNIDDNEAMKYYMYLRSIENMYNLLVPTDEALQSYREPISWAIGGNSREIWSFYYDQVANTVKATVYNADAQGNKLAKKGEVTDKSRIRNRMRDIMDTHIVVGSNANGSLSGFIDEGNMKYALTKGGATLKITGTGDNIGLNGGGDIELGHSPAKIEKTSTGTLGRYDSDNGRTFIIDHMLHDPANSVYQELNNHPEFKAFFDLCRGNEQVAAIFQKDNDVQEIFSTKASVNSETSGLGLVVNSFNNYRYTIFVPTAAALEKAFQEDKNLHTWDEIANDENLATKKQKTIYLLKFLRYHFVDNSIYVSGKAFSGLNYDTGARNQHDKFHKVSVSSNGNDLTVTGENGKTSRVVTGGSLYNLMARDLIVDNKDYTKAKNISSSSRAVIHLVDSALRFE